MFKNFNTIFSIKIYCVSSDICMENVLLGTYSKQHVSCISNNALACYWKTFVFVHTNLNVPITVKVATLLLCFHRLENSCTLFLGKTYTF